MKGDNNSSFGVYLHLLNQNNVRWKEIVQTLYLVPIEKCSHPKTNVIKLCN